MPNISSAQAKNEFSSIISAVQQGEKFIIEYGRKHKKVAMIVPYEEEKFKLKPRKFDLYKGKIHVEFSEDWAMTDEELLGID
ncbi:hypothetical protein [uncultured Gammaproteobacteria bacterium]|uniref:type II toxin-antitoxin system Phd/YefM family antitoxin n=1 Tax=Bathymodiolus heckerae thiotrophic gill symbiont TaxID=1052212 RepID=UPI0010AF5181|nr:type II toxin-antitoxin system Phd/YefM family antitoxin [Bathymodiolus heckerae thiotrophic gill symbiont]CAC9433683.1 hypothetical protein [uncultured Gammaproteobacteria bacterium]SMN13656.1 hypothetical protein BHECKSOX2_779 [Bathymodiolus heckerae thiotrophic gill symbiont]SMN15245.1 hypothetical protein CRYPD_449 [uncultured Candidatus Thioglobus sp.]